MTRSETRCGWPKAGSCSRRTCSATAAYSGDSRRSLRIVRDALMHYGGIAIVELGIVIMTSVREVRDSWSDAAPVPFWLDRQDRPAPRPALSAAERTDLAVVGGGFSGLWTALLAKERDPAREVVLIEADRIASAATGRNGGFCAASLTHGEANGQARFPGELATLDRLGRENLNEIEAAIARYGID